MARSKLAQMKGLSQDQLDPIAGGVGVVTSDTKTKEEQDNMDAMALADIDGMDDDDVPSGTNVGVSGATGVGLFAAGTEDTQAGSTDAQGPVVAAGLGEGLAASQPQASADSDAEADSTDTPDDAALGADADDGDAVAEPLTEEEEISIGLAQMEEAVPVPDEAVSLAVVNAVGEHDDKIEERVNDVMTPLIDVFQDFLGKDGDAAQSLLDETKAQVSEAIAGIIAAELTEHLGDGREALLIGRDIGDPQRGVVAEYCEDVVNSIDANMRDYVAFAVNALEKGQSGDAASAKDIAAAIGQALKENVLPTIVEAADNKAEEIEKDFEKYEKAVENRSEVVDVASGLTNYVAAMSVRDGAFSNIKEAFSELLSEDDATVVAAVAATRAAGTASQALENAMTDLLDRDLGKKFDDEDTTAAAEYMMTHVMEKFGELLEDTSFQKLIGDLPREAETVDEKIKALSAAIEAAIVDVAFDAVRQGVDKEVTATIKGGADGIKAELFLAEFDNWKETSTTLGTPSASSSGGAALAKISLPKEVEITVGEADSGGSSGPSAAMDTKLGSAAAPEVGITGSTGASASAGASDGSALATAGASVGTSFTQRAAFFEQTIAVGATAAAQAYAGTAGVGVGAAFMAGVEVTTDFGGGDKLIQRIATEGHAAAALGLIGASVGAQGSAGIKAYTLTRVETNTDIFDIADVDANAGFEAGAEASAEGKAIIGLKNELKGEATAGYYQSFKADGKINTDLGSVGGGATVVAPGSVGGAVDYKAGFSDGTLSLGLSLELDVLIAGVGLDMNLDINLLGESHTRGSQQEIAESLEALVEHIHTFDEQMTEAKLEDVKEDAEAAVAELDEIQSDMRQRAVAIANFIKNEDELRPEYEQKAAAAQTEIAGLESVADSLRAMLASEQEKLEASGDASSGNSNNVINALEAYLNVYNTQIDAKQDQLDLYNDVLDSNHTEFESMKVYYELEKSFAEDLQSDAQALEVGLGTAEVAERLAPLQAAIKAFDDLTEEEQAAAREDRATYEAMKEHKSSGFMGATQDSVAQTGFLLSHPHILLLESAEDAQEKLPEVMAEYQAVASNTFFNQSNVLVAQVTAANDALESIQEKEVDSLVEMGITQLLSDNMDILQQGGIQAVLNAQNEKISDLHDEVRSQGIEVPVEMYRFFDPKVVFSSVDREESLEEAVSGADEIRDHDPERDLADKLKHMSDMISSFLGTKQKEMTPSDILEMNETIRDTPILKQLFTTEYIHKELGNLKNDPTFQPTAESVSATLETATANYETYSAQAIQAKAAYDQSVDTLRSEHPMLQSQYKLDMCHDNIAELTAYLERDDISDEERAEREAQLGGWQMFLDKNGAALEEDAEEMRAAHKEHLKDLDELRDKHEYLKEIVHEDGLLSWLF